MAYIDDMYKLSISKFGRMKMSHMIADSTDELLAMARKIGVNVKWIQDRGTPREHFDVCISMRAKAIKAGAKEISYRKLGEMVMDRINRSKHSTTCKDL